MTPPASPRVSVVLPVYNAGAPLRDAVESILAQTYTDFELIAVNDGSTDGSGDVLDAYAVRDPRVRVIHQENRKQVATMNRAIDEARGEFVARMDADDQSYPERLAKQVAFLDAHPEVGVVGTLADVSYPDREDVLGCEPGHTMLCWRLLSTTPMVHPSVMMRTAVVRAAGGYAPAAERLEDYDLFYRLSHVTHLATLPERLVWFNRTQETNISTLHFSEQQQVARSIHARVLAAYGIRVRDDVFDGYSRLSSIGKKALDEPGWTARQLAGVATLIWRLTSCFVAASDVMPAEREAIWFETHYLLHAIAVRHGRITGWPRLSSAARVVWAPRLSLWALNRRRTSLQ